MRIAGRLALQRPMKEDRRAVRGEVSVTTTMRALGYHGIDVVVRNISTLGFMAETPDCFPVGAYVRLRLPGLGAVHARVVWCESGQLGAEFVNPVEPGRLSRIMGMSQYWGMIQDRNAPVAQLHAI